MDVRVMGECLTPGMKDGDEAELAAQVPGVGGDSLQRCGHRVEQDGVDLALVLICDRCDLGRHREHDMEIGHWQEVCLSCFEPLVARCALTLGAMPVATGIRPDFCDRWCIATNCSLWLSR
jgi:hypothetical protein